MKPLTLRTTPLKSVTRVPHRCIHEPEPDLPKGSQAGQSCCGWCCTFVSIPTYERKGLKTWGCSGVVCTAHCGSREPQFTLCSPTLLASEAVKTSTSRSKILGGGVPPGGSDGMEVSHDFQPLTGFLTQGETSF